MWLIYIFLFFVAIKNDFHFENVFRFSIFLFFSSYLFIYYGTENRLSQRPHLLKIICLFFTIKAPEYCYLTSQLALTRFYYRALRAKLFSCPRGLVFFF